LEQNTAFTFPIGGVEPIRMAKSRTEDELIETVGTGRRASTPFAVIGVVGTLIACVAGAIILVGLLIWFFAL
jgi:hypothetical protein